MSARAERRQDSLSRILTYIKVWQETGRPGGPSFRDVSRATGIGLGTTHRLCRVLREEGKMQFADNVARSLRVNV